MSHLTELIDHMKDVQEELAELENQRKPLQKELDQLRLNEIPSEMAEENVTSLTGGFGRCTLTSDLYVTPLDKELLQSWLRQEGHSDMIVPTVNAQTLKAFCKEQLKNGVEMPEDILKLTPFSRAVIYPK
jgi:hypothetical protein